VIIAADEVTTQEVKAWRGLHLLHFQGSACSQKVRVLLREKGVPCESHPIDLAREQHISSWYLGINPRGVVPAIVHDGVVHVESNDIMEYVDSQLPSAEASFYPRSHEERAWVDQNVALEDSLHMDLRSLTMGFLMPRRAVAKSEAVLRRWEAEGAANPKRALEVKWWRDFARDGVTAERAQAAVDAHRAAFEVLEDRLARSEWLIGDRRSVLDIAWFITVTRLLAVGYPFSRHPRLASWHERLLQRPAFAEETRAPFLLEKGVVPAYRLFRRLSGSALKDLTR
jgi:glutathione S-transferase